MKPSGEHLAGKECPDMPEPKQTEDSKPQQSPRSSAAFGKWIEFWVISRMLKENMRVYLPVLDDDAIDAIVKREDGTTALVQIKAASKTVKFGDAAGFAAIRQEKVRKDYWFVFYSEGLDKMWIMTSEEFTHVASRNMTGKNIGDWSIWFNGRQTNPETKQPEEIPLAKFDRYLAADFSRIAANTPASEDSDSVAVEALRAPESVEAAPPEIVLEVGCEGGSALIERFRGANGAWRYRMRRDESMLADFLHPEDMDLLDSLTEESESVRTFGAALKLLDKWHWEELTLAKLNAKYAGFVLYEVARRGGAQPHSNR
jgi:hypothetical protein